MRKDDFISANLEYIGSLEASGEKLTKEEWINWIKKESKDYGQTFEEHEIGWLIEQLTEDGFVK